MYFDKDISIRIAKAVVGGTALIIGGLIYIKYRSESLLMFDWFRGLGLTEYIEYFRNNDKTPNVYGWVKYNMPAGLWLFAYMYLIDSIWGKDNNIIYQCFLYILPFIAIISELMQYVGIVPGTYDYMDLLSYVFSIVLFIIIKKGKL
jgi:hypothetical protein